MPAAVSASETMTASSVAVVLVVIAGVFMHLRLDRRF
jgi:hypothetical protein